MKIAQEAELTQEGYAGRGFPFMDLTGIKRYCSDVINSVEVSINI